MPYLAMRRGPGQPTGAAVRVVYMRSRAHSEDGLASAFRSYYAELARLAAFILGDKDAGKDVVQDVFRAGRPA